MMEVTAPSRSQLTARCPLVNECSVTATRSVIGCATSGARPKPGTSTSAATEPPSRVWVGPSPAGVVAHATTSRRSRSAALARVGTDGAIRCMASATNCSNRAATCACAASLSSYTHVMDEPGMMSWNCWSSTSFHSNSSSSTTSAGTWPPAAHHSSASRNRPSQRRLPTFVLDWLVSVPRCISK